MWHANQLSTYRSKLHYNYQYLTCIVQISRAHEKIKESSHISIKYFFFTDKNNDILMRYVQINESVLYLFYFLFMFIWHWYTACQCNERNQNKRYQKLYTMHTFL